MSPSRPGTSGGARPLLRALGWVLRLVLLTAPLLLLRAALLPRPRPLSDFSDRELADIGLSRGDVEPPQARPGAAELELRRLMEGRNWR